ncbi:probable cytosolic oligopeptidase A [Colletes gigas]|uniref:probable cytosolic oligopeptidase A n=1 Tax=Colletes gigas TaxID=935657 RepID=UPI001C9ADE6D|nr:probable cytosolic oligopeptidase A [Colletes gigas]
MYLKNAKMISFLGKRVILSQHNFLKIPKRNGYFVLVPEIGEDLPGKYPLLQEDKSIAFNTVTVEKCVAAIGKQSIEFEDEVKMLGARIKNVANPCPKNLFEDVLNPLEEFYTSLNITWSISKILYFANHCVMPTQYYARIHERAKRAAASRLINMPIYVACRNIINNKEIKLPNEQNKILLKYILEGRLNGLDLSERKKIELIELSFSLINKTKEYAEKLEVAINQFTLTLRDPMILRDFPEEVLKIMAKDNKQYQDGPWTVTLDPIIKKSFMEYCPDRALRWKVWDADVTKTSILQERLLQTSTLLEEIRFERNKVAKLLGYKTYVDLRMETKMAGSLENVYSVLDTLLDTARPAQEYEMKQLNEFANERGMEGKLRQWDVPYWSRKQLYSIYKCREEDLKNYFPLPKVLSGIFELTETLFNVKIVKNTKLDVWHKDVQAFDIFNLKESRTDPVASFYLDAYKKDSDIRLSQGIGYMVTIKERSKASGTKPLAALIFDFQRPFGERPSLLSFKDVRILFQKFGHMLQHTLTTVEYAEIAGFSSIEWDSVFINDYFFENWLYEPFVLQQISCHQDTGEPLSTEMIETLRNSKSHLAGYNLCRELYLSRFDLELYSGDEFWNNIMNRLWSKYFVIPQHKRDCHICSFAPIFSGDWAASYYSDIWSQMLAADLYNVFQEILINKDKEALQEMGNRYRETFLSLGGSYSTNEIFRTFRGRDPNPKALLTNLGLDTKSSMLETNDEKLK